MFRWFGFELGVSVQLRVRPVFNQTLTKKHKSQMLRLILSTCETIPITTLDVSLRLNIMLVKQLDLFWKRFGKGFDSKLCTQHMTAILTWLLMLSRVLTISITKSDPNASARAKIS